MSTKILTPDRSTGEQPGLPSALTQIRATVSRAVAAVCFWLAIALPLIYIPLLTRGGESVGDVQTLGTLLAVNAVALVVGHTHRRG
jgi:hypothetical protein